jgi:hypothetical protein
MPKLLIKNVRMAFPALFEPEAFGDGDPAYGGKFIIPPNHPQVDEIRKAMETAAKERWAEKAPGILKLLKDDKKVAFVEGPYRNKNGETYDGFEGMFTLSTRNGGKSPVRPSAFDAQNRPVTAADGVLYGGCYVDASVEIYPQDNGYGRRINCSLRGVRKVSDGESFGGGTPASADEFGAPAEVEDFV